MCKLVPLPLHFLSSASRDNKPQAFLSRDYDLFCSKKPRPNLGFTSWGLSTLTFPLCFPGSLCFRTPYLSALFCSRASPMKSHSLKLNPATHRKPERAQRHGASKCRPMLGKEWTNGECGEALGYVAGNKPQSSVETKC